MSLGSKTLSKTPVRLLLFKSKNLLFPFPSITYIPLSNGALNQPLLFAFKALSWDWYTLY
jgi:hypothetical protein